MPLFLQSLMGYTAESAGLVLSGGGVLLLLLMPVVGVLSSKVQARYLIAFGWLALAIGMYVSSLRLDLDVSFRSAQSAALAAGLRTAVPFRAHQSGFLRGHARGEKRQRRRAGEFHAQYGQQRGHFAGDHSAGAPRAGPSSLPGRQRDPRPA